ncbi:MAG: response regulator transcription factor [Candidatus Obscuribacterales bacterium]|nr:response regulator transcription factor [Candidatus Obscuribacterales bacterium]
MARTFRECFTKPVSSLSELRLEGGVIPNAGAVMKILLAEDDRFLADGLSMVLKDSGYAVDLAANGVEADLALNVNAYDLLILDLGLPKMDGIEVIKRVRGRGQSLPILVLTARDSLNDRVFGLDVGANDYITKPFQVPELEARIRALLRKDVWANRNEIVFEQLHYDTSTRIATVNGEILDLSAREVALLEIFLQRLGRLVDKSKIARALSNWEEDLSHNAVGITIHRLRKKLEAHGITISAVRGLGYRLEKAE